MYVAAMDEIAVADKYTWKNVRDALRKTYKGRWLSVREECFGFELLYPEVRKETWFKDGRWTYKGLNWMYIDYFIDGKDHRSSEVRAFFDEAIKLGHLVRDTLLQKNIVEAAENKVKMYALTEKGKGLCRQKALRRVSRKEAAKKIANILAAARRFNEDTHESYSITKIVLFGSMLNEEAVDVGDIDVMIDTSRKYDGMEFEEWFEREASIIEKESPSLLEKNPYATRGDNPSKYLKKVTPYLSIEPFCSLDQFEELGVPMMTIFAAPPSISYISRHGKGRGSVTPEEHLRAAENRRKLAEDIGCQELIADTWDLYLE